MVQDGRFICNECEKQIVIAEKQFTRVLIEIVKEGVDRHFCEECFKRMHKPAVRRPVRHRWILGWLGAR